MRKGWPATRRGAGREARGNVTINIALAGGCLACEMRADTRAVSAGGRVALSGRRGSTLRACPVRPIGRRAEEAWEKPDRSSELASSDCLFSRFHVHT